MKSFETKVKFDEEKGVLRVYVPEEIYSETSKILLREEGTEYGAIYCVGEDQEVQDEESEEA